MTQIGKTKGKAPDYILQVKDIIRDLNHKPHRMIKMVIKGEQFPIRDAPLFVRIVDESSREESWLTELSASRQEIIAFFAVDINKKGAVEFGYGNEVLGVFKNPGWKNVKTLDATLIEKEVITVDKKWLKRMSDPGSKEKQ
jgi:hypothetical protein